VFNEDNTKPHKSKIKLLRDAKSKRPPSRYGNRKDQVLWNNERGINPISSIRSSSSNNIQSHKEYYLPAKNLSAIELRGYECKPSNIKISSEFRRILKHKLTENSEKILANLKKLGKGIFSKRENLKFDDDIRHNIYSSRTNPDLGENDISSHNSSSEKYKPKPKNINTNLAGYYGINN
jgi:hypothetical protein